MPNAARSTPPRRLSLALPAGAPGLLEWRSIGPYIGGRVVAAAGVPRWRILQGL